MKRSSAGHAGPIRARDKITTQSELSGHIAREHRRGLRIVFTNGCFDLLHRGHVRSLEQARSLGDRLIVAVNSDASVRRLKGEDRPIQPARTRMELVAALGCVDWVVGFGADTPLRVIRALRPDVLAKGGDWSLDDVVGCDDVGRWGGRVVRLEVVRGERTSELIERARRSAARRKR
ncbi:MAG: D-glycero-beta-D-manno-heptose 1-phosphate adenylyltransferase [Deltaproteobacteria bacterium]|nr:D-glycero-beta-D-manno-heptose 1-phosphate adenylyltransferase [Deltaproteobacteria bacterium]